MRAEDLNGNVSGNSETASGSTLGSVDLVPPTVRFTNPLNQPVVGGTVPLRVSGSDNVGVALVAFYVDGIRKLNDLALPFGYDWNTEGLTGAHTLKVVAYDWMMRHGEQTLTVTAGGPAMVNGAEVISVTGVSDQMRVGEVRTATVAVRNTGNTTWSNAGLFRLGPQNPADNTTWTITPGIDLPPGETVGPNQTKVFSFEIKAPAVAGTYNFQWQMRQDQVGWFGAATENRSIVVLPLDTEAPPIPTLTATSLESSIRLEWSAVTDDASGGSGVSRYVVRVSTKDTFTPCLEGWEHQSFAETVTSTTLVGLSYDTTYYAQIKSSDRAGNSSEYSFYVSSKVLTDQTKPLISASPTVTGLEGKLKVEWEPAVDTGGSGLRYYHIYVSSIPNSSSLVYTKAKISATLSSATLSTTAFRAETTYYVRMRAQDYAGNVSLYTPTVSAMTLADATNPNPPASVTVSPKYKAIELSWPQGTDSGGSGVAGYRVDVSSSSNFSSHINGWDKRSMVTVSTSVVSLSANKLYYAQVWTVDGAGNMSETAIAGSTKTLSTPSQGTAELENENYATAPTDVDGARAYPVPFRPEYGASGITFDRIPAETAMRIYTIDGRPVKTLTTNEDGSVLWDLTNDEDAPVSSGVYLAIIEKNGGRKRLKVVVQK